MENARIIKFSNYIISGLFFTGIFVFFAFLYNNHLHFGEQFQLFLFTDDYLFSRLKYPGGFSGYLGQFLTQFYYVSLAGPVIITVLLFMLQRVVRKILARVNPDPVLFPLSFITPLMAGMILCSEFYPLSAVTGFLLAMFAGSLYMNIRNGNIRFITGLFLIPLTYWLAGGSWLSLVALMLVYELLNKVRPTSQDISSFKLWHLAAYLVLAGAIPFIVRNFLIQQPVMVTILSEFYYKVPATIPASALVLFTLPPALMILVSLMSVKERYYKKFIIVQFVLLFIISFSGFGMFANFNAERIMTYDYLVRTGRWNDVIRYAGKSPPRNFLSLAMLNLSLAETVQLGNIMFRYDQHGINGLFLAFDKEYVAPLLGNEIFYSLGLTNAAQEYAFESMESIPDLGKSARVLKRLAETNLINGNYGVAEKYIAILEKTLFYRRWARNTRSYLYNEAKINSHPVWGEKRKFMVRNDYFFSAQNMEAALVRMVKEHPDNRKAFEYLIAFYLINKDLRTFMNYIPAIERMNYKTLPVSYQEAILYIVGLDGNNPVPGYISNETKARMKAYADIYTRYQDAGERLKAKYSGTYWYYLHFVQAGNAVEQRDSNTR